MEENIPIPDYLKPAKKHVPYMRKGAALFQIKHFACDGCRSGLKANEIETGADRFACGIRSVPNVAVLTRCLNRNGRLHDFLSQEVEESQGNIRMIRDVKANTGRRVKGIRETAEKFKVFRNIGSGNIRRGGLEIGVFTRQDLITVRVR